MANTPTTPVYDYLCIDQYLTDFMDVQLLKSAFENGLIDLLQSRPHNLAELQSALHTDSVGLRFMLDLLGHNGVILNNGETVCLTQEFEHALQYRSLMEVKIEFANFLAPDVMQSMSAFIRDEREFMANSRLFELFDYQRALESTPENYQFTQRWVSLTTALTQHEAQVCLDHHDFSSYQQLMDIGGNSGEFVSQICRANPNLQATVIDLPVVCEVGNNHLKGRSEASRIQFQPANALEDKLPTNQDIVTFKSILHDWPEPGSQRFLSQAHSSLKPGGKVLIFERAPINLATAYKHGNLAFGNLPTFLFFRSYRPASIYVNQLQDLGFTDINIELIPLETDFYLITASKG
ncbi:methyltransferase [Maricurvus nonylphenolicus]